MVTGVVNKKYNNPKQDAIVLSDGTKYSMFGANSLSHVNEGDTVSFDFKQNGQYNNIRGTVTVTGQGANSASNTDNAGASAASTTVAASQGFPIALLDRQRSIIRQNSLARATELYIATYDCAAAAIDESVADIITIARKFEEFSAGDLDRDMAESAAKKLEDATMNLDG